MLESVHAQVLRVVSVVTGALTGGLVLLVCANVFARYVLAAGILWSEELSRLLFVWVVFLGAYIALCRDGHMAVVMVINKIDPAGRRWVRLFGLILVLILLVILGFAGARLTWTTYGFGRQTPILGISAAWGYMAVPVSCALMGLQTLRGILATIRKDARPDVPDQATGEGAVGVGSVR